MNDSQLLKGILEGCVLGIISQGETYGYEIISELEQYGFRDIGEGTLYPILTRLDKNGYIRCRKDKSPLGPIRKYYSITNEGMNRLMEFSSDYRKMKQCTDMILEKAIYKADSDNNERRE
ncbi:MAG: PadR family transcriptional regulator [Lachnospira sp.]|nr:PadR family transcriptional regulator [Lachnospira sp.]